jgi:hypothetical protein
MDDPEIWGSWLLNHQAIRASHPDVRYFAAIEIDARGIEPFVPLLDALSTIDGDWWTYHLDDRRSTVNTANRLRHLTVGQNLATDFALSDPACTHMLFLAADLEPPPDTLPKLLELDHPLVGGHVPTYCLDGPVANPRTVRVPTGASGDWWPEEPAALWPDMDVRVHMASAAFLLIRRDLLRFVRWRWDLDAGMSDDPALHHDARTFHGVETLVRHDVIGRHHPEAIGPIETRFPGIDMTVHRDGIDAAADPPWVDHHAASR